MATFVDPRAEACFASHGFVCLPFLDAASLLALQACIDAIEPRIGSSMIFSDHHLDPAARTALRHDVTNIVTASLHVLSPHRVVSASFVSKPPGPANSLAWHLDPAITDERRWASLSLWIPLSDVDATNGALEVIDSGHSAAPANRGGMGDLIHTHPDPSSWLGLLDADARPTGPLNTPAGNVVAYDHRLPHRSGPNSGETNRVAVNVGLVPQDAPLLLNVWRDDRTFDVISVPDDFFSGALLDVPPQAWPGARVVATHRLASRRTSSEEQHAR